MKVFINYARTALSPYNIFVVFMAFLGYYHGIMLRQILSNLFDHFIDPYYLRKEFIDFLLWFRRNILGSFIFQFSFGAGIGIAYFFGNFLFRKFSKLETYLAIPEVIFEIILFIVRIVLYAICMFNSTRYYSFVSGAFDWSKKHNADNVAYVLGFLFPNYYLSYSDFVRQRNEDLTWNNWQIALEAKRIRLEGNTPFPHYRESVPTRPRAKKVIIPEEREDFPTKTNQSGGTPCTRFRDTYLRLYILSTSPVYPWLKKWLISYSRRRYEEYCQVVTREELEASFSEYENYLPCMEEIKRDMRFLRSFKTLSRKINQSGDAQVLILLSEILQGIKDSLPSLSKAAVEFLNPVTLVKWASALVLYAHATSSYLGCLAIITHLGSSVCEAFHITFLPDHAFISSLSSMMYKIGDQLGLNDSDQKVNEVFEAKGFFSELSSFVSATFGLTTDQDPQEEKRTRKVASSIRNMMSMRTLGKDLIEVCKIVFEWVNDVILGNKSENNLDTLFVSCFVNFEDHASGLRLIENIDGAIRVFRSARQFEKLVELEQRRAAVVEKVQNIRLEEISLFETRCSDWAASIKALCEIDDILYTQLDVDKMELLEKETKTLLTERLSLERNSRAYEFKFMDLLKWEKTLVERIPVAKKRVKEANYRVEPVLIVFDGPPGQGKTLYVSLIAKFLLRKMGFFSLDEGKIKEHMALISCTQPDKDGRMDNYHPDTKVLILDEMFQKTDSSENAAHLHFLLRLVNVAPFNAPTAMMSDKGANFIHPRAVILTTNREDLSNSPQFGVVTKDNGAFIRRVDFRIRVVGSGNPLKDLSENTVRFKLNGSKADCVGDPSKEIDLETLLEKIWTHYQLKNSRFDQYSDKISDYLDGLMSKKTNEGLFDYFNPPQTRMQKVWASVRKAWSYVTGTVYLFRMVLSVLDVGGKCAKIYFKIQNRLFVWKNRILWAKGWIQNNKKKTIAALFVVVLITTVAICIYLYFRRKDEVRKQNEGYEKDKKQKKAHVKHEIGKINHSADIQVQSIANSIVRKNLRTVEVGNRKQVALGICGEWYVTSAHLFLNLEHTASVTHRTAFDSVGVSRLLMDCEIRNVPDTDLALYRFPNTFAKDIRKFFFYNDDLIKLSGERNVYPTELWTLNVYDEIPQSAMSSECYYDSSAKMMDETGSFITNGYLTSNIPTSYGHCGGFYMSHDPRKNVRKIGFIHTGKTTNKAVGDPLTQENIASILPDLVVNESVDQELVKENHALVFREETNVNRTFEKKFPGSIYLGTVESSSYSRIMKKSEIYRSLYKPEKLSTAPLNLQPFVNERGELKVPMRYYSDKLAKFHGFPVSMRALRQVTEDLHLEWRPNVIRKSKLDNFEILNSVTGSMLHSVQISTSAGHAHRKEVTKGKFPLILYDGETFHFSDKFEKDLLEYETNIWKNNRIPSLIVKDQLKDERKELADVQNGKARIFSGCTLEYWCIFRKYFGAWLDSVRNQSPFGPCMVGIEATGPEWHFLYKHLVNVGVNPKFINGDYKGFDIGFPYEIRAVIMEEILRWYSVFCSDSTDRDQLIRKRILQASMFHVHIYEWLVYGRCNGIDSGNPATAEFNSVGGEIIVRTCFFRIAMENGRELFEARKLYRDAVRGIYYGDDNLIAVRHDLKWFNQVTLANMISRTFGMVYTRADKGDFGDQLYTPFKDISFLKRTFKPLTGTFGKGPVVGVLPVGQCEDIACWIRRSAGSEKEATRQNMEASLREFWFHGENMFNHMRKEYNKCLLDNSIDLITLKFSDLSDYYNTKF